MTSQLISSIRIEGLFGLYSYRVPTDGGLENAAILYGDNGVGKTTLLRLVFHLISGAGDRGHRTALLKGDYRLLEVKLANGTTLTADRKADKSTRILTLSISKGPDCIAVWEYQPASERRSGWVVLDEHGRTRRVNSEDELDDNDEDEVPRGEEAYLEALRQCIPTTYLLNADRRLDSDTVPDPSDEVELRRLLNRREPKSLTELVERSREIALSQALSTAASWIAQKAVRGANQGSMNVHSVYTDILTRLISSASGNADVAETNIVGEMINRLKDIQAKTEQHSEYDLATPLSTEKFQNVLRETGSAKLAAEFLSPYVESLESRLRALDPIYNLIDRFITVANQLLRDKTITYKLGRGFFISNRLGIELTPAKLSSGEQQLLLLFCYVLVARQQPSVFIIDEPELSLNIKWQRELVQSLLSITQDAEVQFIFASHSMELLAQHRNRVVKLEAYN